MSEWKLIRTFSNEGEARVVESFLGAQGFEVQLHGTHSLYVSLLPSRKSAIRLMVRESDFEAITQVLAEQERRAHLSVADEDED